MRALRLVSVVIVGLAALLAAGPVPQAHAAPPSIERIVIDQTVQAGAVAAACGFPVLRHDQLSITVHVFTDNSGNVVKEIDNYYGTVTFMANGHSAVGRNDGPETTLFHPDGSLTITDSGPTRFVVSPGAGPVWGDTGHFVVEIDPNDNVISMTFSGLNSFGNVAGLCAALAP